MSSFEGKVAVITGGAHGIGKEIALQFAQRGAHTVIADFNEANGAATAEEISASYPQSLFIKSDVSSMDDMAQVRDATIKEFGRMDFLILDAGIGMKSTLDGIGLEDWQWLISINLTGLFTSVKAFLKEFETNQGAIVYISSGSALSGTGGCAAYPASKAGGEGFIRALAKELGPKGVNVNAIAPRLIDTGEMMRVNYPTQEKLDSVLKTIPVGRFGTPQDVANLAVFLADPANSYIQGQTILLDGGRTIA